MSIEAHKMTSCLKSKIIDRSIYLIVKDDFYYIKNWSIDNKKFIIDTDLRLNRNLIVKATIVIPTRGKKTYLRTIIKFEEYKDGTYAFKYRRVSDDSRDILNFFTGLAVEDMNSLNNNIPKLF